MEDRLLGTTSVAKSLVTVVNVIVMQVKVSESALHDSLWHR